MSSSGVSSVLFSGLNTARVAFAPDLDETYHQWVGGNRRSGKIANPWGLRAQNRFLDAHRDDVAVVFNTSNTLRDMKKRIALLQGAPLDALVLENGKKVFLNPDEIPAEAWLTRLTEEDSDAGWDATVQNISNWSLIPAKRVIRQTLLEEGYTSDAPDDVHKPMSGTLPNGTPVKLEFLDTHSAFDLITPDNDPATLVAAQAETDRLAEKIIRNMVRNAGILVDASGFDMPEKTGGHLYVKDFEPAGVNKGSALQYIVKKMPQLQAVITAGDNELNDPPAMTRLNYINAQGELVPNLPIVMSARPAFTEAMADHPNAVNGTPGSINPALKKQLKKLDRLA